MLWGEGCVLVCRWWPGDQIIIIIITGPRWVNVSSSSPLQSSSSSPPSSSSSPPSWWWSGRSGWWGAASGTRGSPSTGQVPNHLHSQKPDYLAIKIQFFGGLIYHLRPKEHFLEFVMLIISLVGRAALAVMAWQGRKWDLVLVCLQTLLAD